MYTYRVPTRKTAHGRCDSWWISYDDLLAGYKMYYTDAGFDIRHRTLLLLTFFK